MAYYPDLTACDYFGRWQDVLVAVGWHDVGHPFAQGDVSKDFFEALVRLSSDAWQPVAVAGHQRCPFCRFTGGPAELRFAGSTIVLGTSNLFVPGKEHVYVSPGLIVHYVDAHDYCPPSEFQQAVMSSPNMKSVAYLREMKSRGLLR